MSWRSGKPLIYYLTTEKHSYTLRTWIEHYSDILQGRVRILPYERCYGSFERGTFIFGDVERLSPRMTRRASGIWAKLRNTGCRPLTHPARSLRRYDLQKALRNDFRVFRPHEVPSDLRYPVFLRGENDHNGPRTQLIADEAGYLAARQRFPRKLVVEFLDTRDAEGVFRKYSAIRVGDTIIARHVFFSRSWVQKGPDLLDEPLLQEEADYCEKNPHAAELRRIFDLAGVEYGRIDYTVWRGRLQVWEINTNHYLVCEANADGKDSFWKRATWQRRSGDAFNAALLDLDLAAKGLTMRLGLPRTLSPESRFVA